MKKTLSCAVDNGRTAKNVCRAPRSQNARQSQIGQDGLPDRPDPPFNLPPIPTNPTCLPLPPNLRHPPPASQTAPPAPLPPNPHRRLPPSPTLAAPSSPSPRRWLPPLPPRASGSLLEGPIRRPERGGVNRSR
jgi:hypothetical protein